MLKNFKISTRLLLSFGLILLLTFVNNFVTIGGLNQSNQAFQNFIAHPAQAYSDVQTCRIEVNIAARLLREMLLNPDVTTYDDYETKINDSIKVLDASIESLKKSYGTSDGLVAEYEAIVDDWVAIGMRAIDTMNLRTPEGDAEASRILLKECVPALEKAVVAAQALSDSCLATQHQAETSNLHATQVKTIVAVCIFILTIILSFIISSRVTRSIVKPLREVDRVSSEMSKGNLHEQITYVSKDEVGQLADSIRESMSVLSSYIDDIDRAMSEMSEGNFNVRPSQPFIGDFKHIEVAITHFILNMTETLGQIQSASNLVDNYSEHVSAAAQELSQGATEQAASIEKLSENIDEISRQIRENADNAELANHATEQVSAEMEVSNQQMKQMMDAMNEISHSSEEIGKIIKTIEDIAFQTNILALNAAVEAARAGAAGKGFAVVADEVRNLASKSAEASKNTASLIQNSMAAVQNGSDITKKTAKSLNSVVERALDVAHTVEKIAKASDEQAVSVGQVTQNVDQIAGVMQNNSSSSEQSAAASEELACQASTLKNLLKRFTLFRAD